MILVMGHIRMKAGEAAKAKDLLAKHMADVAAEDGCEHYSFAFDAADPDTIRVSERWASPEAIAAHGQQPHQKAFGRALRDFAVEEVSVKAWDGEFWRTLVGD